MMGPMIILFTAGCYYAKWKAKIAGWAMWYLLYHSFISHKESRYSGVTHFFFVHAMQIDTSIIASEVES